MEQTWEVIRGDTPGAEWRFPVLRFGPRGTANGPPAYLQGGLHADELPGVGTLHALGAKLRLAEARGDLRSDITVVPFANPIGLNQQVFGASLGRFEFGSRTNFNRAFPLLDRPDPALLPDDPARPAAERLKARLLALALPAEIVLDLHCDDESVPYLYIHKALWPAMQDLASALGCEAVLLWEDGSDAAFEEAALAPWLKMSPDEARLDRRVVSTVELRGQADVDAALAEQDAEGLYRFLIGRGAIDGDISFPAWSGIAAPLEQVEMVRAPIGGGLWYDVRPGDKVAAGDRLVTILHSPGEENGGQAVLAPQDGYILTRRRHRMTRSGEDLLKLVAGKPSRSFKPGALEA